MSEIINISICICTYNRCRDLDITLQSLLENNNELINGDEILLIDNNSNDRTKEIVNNYNQKLPIFYFFEPNQGLSAARNSGLAEFNNQVILFVDDDITITPGFFDEYRSAFNKYPDISFFGGKIHVDWQGKKPRWYQSTELPLLNGMLGHYDQGEDEHEFNNQTLLPYGANFALRRDLINAVGLFKLGLGVKGDEISRGEETDYFRRAILSGFKGKYLPTVKVYHRFQIERISLLYLYKYGVQKGVEAVRLGNTESKNIIKKYLYQMSSGVYQLLKLRRDRFYQCVINIGLLRGIRITSKLQNNNYHE